MNAHVTQAWIAAAVLISRRYETAYGQAMLRKMAKLDRQMEAVRAEMGWTADGTATPPAGRTQGGAA